MNRTLDQGQPLRRPTLTGNRSDLLPAMGSKLRLQRYRDQMAHDKRPSPSMPRAPPTPKWHFGGYGHKPSLDPENTLGLVWQTPQTWANSPNIPTPVSSQGYRAISIAPLPE